MKKKYYQEDVDRWVKENQEYDATNLFNTLLLNHCAKLDRLDKRIQVILAEIREVFPDSEYYKVI